MESYSSSLEKGELKKESSDTDPKAKSLRVEFRGGKNTVLGRGHRAARLTKEEKPKEEKKQQLET